MDAAANLESALDMEELRVLEEDWTNVLQPTLNQKCMKFPKKLEAGTRKLQHYYLQRNTFFILQWCGKREAGSGRRCHYDPRGKKVKESSWDLRTATNNKAEVLAVLQGLKIPKLLGMGELRVLEEDFEVLR